MNLALETCGTQGMEGNRGVSPGETPMEGIKDRESQRDGAWRADSPQLAKLHNCQVSANENGNVGTASRSLLIPITRHPNSRKRRSFYELTGPASLSTG